MTIVFDERFEVVGYDNGAAWQELVGGVNSIDEDADPTDVGNPSGWGNRCLKITHSDESTNAYILHQGSLGPDSWIRLEFIITSHSLEVGGKAHIVAAWDAAWGVAYALNIRNNAGVKEFQLSCNHDDTNNTYTAFTSFSLNTLYRVNIKWDSTNDVWAWRINGVNQPNDVDLSDPVTSEGILSSTYKTNLSKFLIGQLSSGANDPVTYYFDLFTIDGNHWVGGGPEISSSSGTYTP